jgi:hypothetical protein
MLAFSGFKLLKGACYSERACAEDRVAASAYKGRRDEKQLCSIYGTTQTLGLARQHRPANHAAILGAGQFYTDLLENFRTG